MWTTLLVLDLLFPIGEEKFPKLKAYLKMLEENHPNYKVNMDGAKKQVDLIDKCMEKAKNYHINQFELIYPKPIWKFIWEHGVKYQGFILTFFEKYI